MQYGRVLGPIGGTRAPWGAPRVDLAQKSYVCEEYQLEGTATGYGHADSGPPQRDGHWMAGEIGEAPYRTRILVVRPEDPSAFNGTVLVHWQNVSAGFEMGRPENDELFHGYAWVGVSAQQVGHYGLPMGMNIRGGARAGLPLVDADPERYGSLTHPGDPGSFDIFGQAAAAVGPGRNGDVDPLGGLDVRRVVATGASQSAMRLVAYANGVHPLHRLVDGYLLSVWEGRAPRLDEGPISTGGTRVAIRDDLGVPVLVVNSEFEAAATATLSLPDTETFRMWEVAGTAHAAATRQTPTTPGGWAPNPLSWAPVHEAALGHIHRWLVDGVPAPSQPRIAVDAGTPPRVRRDDHGNGVGGIRLPELEAPIAEYRGTCFGTGSPPLFGGYRPFDTATLRALHPSRDAYVRRWRAAVDDLVTAGTLRAVDAPAMRERADAVAALLPLTGG